MRDADQPDSASGPRPDARLELPLLPRWFRWAAFTLALTTVAILSLLPHRSLGGFPAGSFEGADKLAHVGMYVSLALVLGYAIAGHGRGWHWGEGLLALLGLVAFGALMEGLQGLSPGRNPDVLDALANALGSLAILAWAALRPRVRLVPVGGS